MKNLLLRTVTGIVFVSVVVGSIILSDLNITGIPFAVLMVLVALVGTWEYLKMAGVLRHWFQTCVTLVVVATFTITPSLFSFSYLWLLQLCGVLFFLYFTLLCAIELFRKGEKGTSLHNISLYLVPLFWIVLPILLMQLMASESAPLLLALFIFIWLNDTLAYCAGSLFGRHKLCERISPKKTMEGFFIALVLTVAVSVSFAYIGYFMDGIGWNPLQWVGFAFVVVLFGTLGDLVESMFKRACGVKDSGNILPGHGGLLDRFDSVLLAVPVAFLYSAFVYSLLL